MLFRSSLFLTATLALAFSAPAFGESAGTVQKLASLFGPDAASPRQSATVPISVVHAATFAEFGVDLALAPNTFATIFGPVAPSSPAQTAGSGSLVNRSGDWSQAFQGSTAPTSLNGVRVMVNGKPAFISFTGLGSDFGRQLDQVNFISPDDDARGPVTIEVFKDDQMVSSTIVNLDSASAALFAYSTPDSSGNLYYAGLTAAPDTAFVAPTALFGVSELNGVPIRPARPGEIVQLFGTGFGATNPPVPAGQITPGIAALVEQGAIRIGGLPAEVFYQGLAPGLTSVYQFNVTVPDLPDGNHRIEIDVQGKTTPLNAFLPVRGQ